MERGITVEASLSRSLVRFTHSPPFRDIAELLRSLYSILRYDPNGHGAWLGELNSSRTNAAYVLSLEFKLHTSEEVRLVAQQRA